MDDTGSVNGVYVNGKKVKQKWLQEGDHISFGACCSCAQCLQADCDVKKGAPGDPGVHGQCPTGTKDKCRAKVASPFQYVVRHAPIIQ